MVFVQRHDLLVLTPQGRERLCERIRFSGEESADQMAELFGTSCIPGIVRRHAPCDGSLIGIGISFPLRRDGQRLRFAAAVTAAEIADVITPYALVEGAFECSVRPLQALARIKTLGLARPGNLGVYGAAALQMVTGLPYVHDRSDLDLIIRGETIDSLRHANERLSALEHDMAITVDVEVVLGCDGEAKLKELCSQQKTVLVKSMQTVDIMNKNHALGSLPAL